jgi:hypothetical protein
MNILTSTSVVETYPLNVSNAECSGSVERCRDNPSESLATRLAISQVACGSPALHVVATLDAHARFRAASRHGISRTLERNSCSSHFRHSEPSERSETKEWRPWS